MFSQADDRPDSAWINELATCHCCPVHTLIFEDETIDGIALLSASDCKSEKQLCAKACKKLASLIVSEQRAVHIRKPELDVGHLNPLDVADM